VVKQPIVIHKHSKTHCVGLIIWPTRYDGISTLRLKHIGCFFPLALRWLKPDIQIEDPALRNLMHHTAHTIHPRSRQDLTDGNGTSVIGHC